MILATTLLALPFPQDPAAATLPRPLPFARQTLSTEFLCEGAAFGDLDGDGDPDVVAGPWWYEGPEFTVRHALYPAKQFPRLQYSDNFFAWIHDLDGDGRNDIFVVGFPGQAAFWLQNTGTPDEWRPHLAFEGVDNESPWFVDVTGDGRPDLVCQNQDRLGWAEADWSDPTRPWTFHAALPQGAGPKFTHGLGVGDLNGDGRPDLLRKEGWYEQPASLERDPVWPFHAVAFSPAYGGAQMLVHDVDGDGDADVVTSYAAHHWGLGWFEQQPDGVFTAHEVLPPQRAEGNVSELHALCLCDLDGDGLMDVVTGKRWWSHGPTHDGNQDGANDPAWLLGLLLRRDAEGARFEVVLLDDDSGVGTQVAAGLVDGDALPDVVVANKKGTFVLRQQPRGAQDPQGDGSEGQDPDLDFESGTLRGWTATGNAFQGQPIRGAAMEARVPGVQSGQSGAWMIGGYELLEDGAVGTLTSAPFTVTQPWATFRIGGGKDPKTRVEVLDESGNVICSASGNDREDMYPVLVDLRARQGQRVRVRLVDESTGGWGHLNFDDFAFHGERVRGTLPDSIQGLSPAAAAAAMRAPDGFAVDLIAAEPDLHQPIALWIDERARLWVAEAYSYPEHAGDAAKDTILVFEDRDRDGSFETRTEFTTGLDLVSGLCTGFGGVWIGAAPNLLFVPDADGDLVPDGPPEVVLDGFGFEDTHETLNSFTWGPDGWLYGTHGVFTHSRVGAPGTPDEQRVGLNCGVWRFHPQRRAFEVFAWGTSNPWGVDFDERGEAFLACCVIPHLWHMVPGGRYQRQGGSHFDAHPWIEIQTIADHAHFAGATRDHAWWGGRNRPVADPATDALGGGHAHCGTLVYQGDSFPAEYRNAVLFFNIHGNRLNQDRLERRGSGYVGHHADDLVLANDPWFRGVSARQGPNGEVFFIDWYDKNACHRSDPLIWDRTNGRMYRLSHGAPAPAASPLASMSDDELAVLQVSTDGFATAHARRLLQERGDVAAGAKARLRALLEDPDPLVRLRALWALHAVSDLDTELLLATADSPHEALRGWAVRLACEQPERFPLVIAELAPLAREEASPAVRLQLASALQRLAPHDGWDLAAALLAHGEDDDDHNIPTVLWYGVERLADDDPARFVQLAAGAELARVRRLMWRRAAIGDDALRAALVAHMRADGGRLAEILPQLVEALDERPGMDAPHGWTELSSTLMRAEDTAVREAAADVALAFGDATLAPVFRARLADPEQKPSRRRAALAGLVRLRDPDTGPMLLELLDDADLRRAALEGLGAYDLAEAPARILAVLPRLEPIDRELALATLAARPSSAQALLQSILAGATSDRLLDAASLRRQLQLLGDAEVEELLQRAWGRSVPPSASAAADIERYKALLTPEYLETADPANGRAVFARTCQACHRLYGAGGTLAPDLTGSDRRNLDYLLANVIDPSAEMGREYQMVTVRLRDGRQLTGNIQKETDTAVTLKTLAGKQVIARRDLADDAEGRPAIERSQFSLMPAGQLQMLLPEDARDLIAYLRSDEQVAIAASPENLGAFFDGESLAGWTADPDIWSVEDGELVGRTAEGLEHNDFAQSQLVFGDFRLEVEVKLTPDAANSGIQFRSEPAPGGEVRGYQADIGKGWWGLLYEELGRGVLQKAAADPVRPGEWNHYEILATGDRVQLAINGVRTVDLTDTAGAKQGIVALQVHSGGPTEVRFRGFAIELDPEPVLRSVR
ncbi:MAG: PVC-type heme-binding CxxCH protein [Planctomycetota bacterium]